MPNWCVLGRLFADPRLGTGRGKNTGARAGGCRSEGGRVGQSLPRCVNHPPTRNLSPWGTDCPRRQKKKLQAVVGSVGGFGASELGDNREVGKKGGANGGVVGKRGWNNGWMDGQRCWEGGKDGCLERGLEGCLDGQMDRWADGWRDGWVDIGVTGWCLQGSG